MDYSVLNTSVRSDRLFFGEAGHGIPRYDVVRYPALKKINKHMRSLFWEPEAVDVSGERRSFDLMTDSEQFIFTSNLSRQIILDGGQARSVALVFLPHCTDPMLENCIATWSFFETIHSESYTHIIKAIYPNPEAIVDALPGIAPIVECARSISEAANPRSRMT